MLGIFIIETSFQQQQPAASQARKHARNPLTIRHLSFPPPSLPTFKLQSGDLATPLLVVVAVALITNASCWQKSSWPSCAKQTKTSLGPGVAAQRGEKQDRGRGGDSARVMARQAHALCEQVKRLTVRRRIGSDRTEVEVGVRVKRSLVSTGRQANRGAGSGVDAWPSRCWTLSAYKLRVAALPLLCHCSAATAAAAAALAPQRRPQFIYFKT